MHIRKPRKAGHGWNVIVSMGGKQVSKSFKSLKAAKAWGHEKELNAERGEVGLPQSVTLATAFATFLKDKAALTPNTLSLYNTYWKNHLKPAFGSKLVGAIKPAELQTWIGRLTSETRTIVGQGGHTRTITGLSPASVARVVQLMKAILSHAVKGKLIASNAAVGLAVPKLQKVREATMYLPDELDRVLAACNTPRKRALVLVALGTGLRLGELMAMRWEWIDAARGVIRLPASLEAEYIPKGKKAREVPLLPEVAAALEAWKPETSGHGAVFTGTNWRRWAAAIREATGRARAAERGIKLRKLPYAKRMQVIRENAVPFRWHQLRHTYLSRLVMGGVHLSVVQAVAGHASVTTTQIYSHLSPDAFDDVRKKMGLIGIGLKRDSESASKEATKEGLGE